MALSAELAIYGLSSASILPTLQGHSTTAYRHQQKKIQYEHWKSPVEKAYLKRLARRTCSPHKRNSSLTPSLSTRVISFLFTLPDIPWISFDWIDSILHIEWNNGKKFLNYILFLEALQQITLVILGYNIYCSGKEKKTCVHLAAFLSGNRFYRFLQLSYKWISMNFCEQSSLRTWDKIKPNLATSQHKVEQ